MATYSASASTSPSVLRTPTPNPQPLHVGTTRRPPPSTTLTTKPVRRSTLHTIGRRHDVGQTAALHIPLTTTPVNCDTEVVLRLAHATAVQHETHGGLLHAAVRPFGLCQLVGRCLVDRKDCPSRQCMAAFYKRPPKHTEFGLSRMHLPKRFQPLTLGTSLRFLPDFEVSPYRINNETKERGAEGGIASEGTTYIFRFTEPARPLLEA